MKAEINKRQLNYFLSLLNEGELVNFLDQKKVRDKLIKTEFYKLISEMGNMEAYAKLANDFGLSRIAIIKIISE